MPNEKNNDKTNTENNDKVTFAGKTFTVIFIIVLSTPFVLYDLFTDLFINKDQ